MNIEKFCEFDYIRKKFLPLTPYGKIYKENIKLINDKKTLEYKYDAIDIFLRLRKDKRFDYDKIRYHLKNVPYINHEKKVCDAVDIFLYKKFINNYYAIYSILNKKEKEFFLLKWELDELYKLLNIDGFSDTFYISDKYDKRLDMIRREISDIISDMERKKKDFLSIIKDKFSLPIEGDFIIIESSKVKPEFNEYFNIEIYDGTRVLMKPRLPQDYIELFQKKEKKIAEEKKIENEVISSISQIIEKVREKISEYIDAICKIDIAISSAELAADLNLKRPKFSSTGVYIRGGEYLPVKEELEKLKINYTPLSFSFNKRLNIIQGSNMGGKTVALKTIIFLQIMAQYGFFVPAKEFHFIIFDDIQTIMVSDEIKGLSSFAYEIYEYVKFMENCKGHKSLLIMDEFAKTTNVMEATALLNSIIEDLSERNNIYLFFATHFSDISYFKNIDFLRMKGFNKIKYLKYFQEKKDLGITDKIKIINRFMDYEIIRVKDSKIKGSDAIDIAHILGVDIKICENAMKFMEEEYEKTKKT
ncbi:MAG: hypothetical protein K6357_01485 [Elusimicrobiota bacterium]